MKSRTNQNNRLPLNVSSEEDEGGYYVQRVDASSVGQSKAGKTISQAQLTKQTSQSQYIPQVLPNESFKKSTIGEKDFVRESIEKSSNQMEEIPENVSLKKSNGSNMQLDYDFQETP